KAHVMAGALPAGLLACSPGPDDHNVRAHHVKHFLVSGLEPFADGDHEHDGGDAPGDAKHREQAAQLVGPDVAQRLGENFAKQGHGRTSLSPALRPCATSVRWPLEMPTFSGTLRHPVLALESSSWTEAFLSLS